MIKDYAFAPPDAIFFFAAMAFVIFAIHAYVHADSFALRIAAAPCHLCAIIDTSFSHFFCLLLATL